MEIKVSDIIGGERKTRRGHGLLDPLERSIAAVGVLQPIGITPDKKLIFGVRRLQACKNIGKETIPVRMFDIEADDPVTALMMERDENEQREELTPSEKVALGERIEDAQGNRQGQRTDLELPSFLTERELPQNFREVAGQRTDFHNIGELSSDLNEVKGKKSMEIAAEAVDMKPTTYYQAKAVVHSGNEEVIQKMDSGEIPIYKAYETVQKKSKPKTFRITLYKSPNDDAVILLSKGGRDYCTKLGCALLKLAGHKVEV